ncbi:MAG: polysaccharide biosynthesis/export family protein [Noviherbaspirillum sp.]
MKIFSTATFPSTSISSSRRMRGRAWGLLLTLPVLAACSSVGPGMQFERGVGASYTSSGEAGADSLPVQTSLKTITPQLVRQEKALRDKQSTQDISRLVGTPSPYTIEAGDILSIVVWDHPELSGAVQAPGTTGIAGVDPGPGTTPAPGFVVDHQGTVQFPYAGTLKLAGMTEDQARKELTSKLARYINKPVVTLRVQSYRSKRIYVDGEVKAPGMHPINDIPMTLVEAINRAGGMLPTADQSQISLIRGGEAYQINLPELVQRGVNPATIMLANGDVLRVLSRDANKVFVSGEVITPRSLTMHNGRLTLNEALGESGGINPLSGDASQIYVVRKSSTEPIVYRLDAHAPGALAMAEGFELQPKDVVYVAATPLANWHRTISQILPGALSSAVGSVNQPR